MAKKFKRTIDSPQNMSFEEKSIKDGFEQYIFFSGKEHADGMDVRVKIEGDAVFLAKLIVAGLKEFRPLEDFVREILNKSKDSEDYESKRIYN